MSETMTAKFTVRSETFTWDAKTEGVIWGTFYGGFHSRHALYINSHEIRNLAIEAFKEIRERSSSINLLIPHWDTLKMERETAKFVHCFEVAFNARYKQKG